MRHLILLFLFFAGCDLHVSGSPTHVEFLQEGRIVSRWSDGGFDLRSGVVMNWSATVLDEDAVPWQRCAAYQPSGALGGRWYEACDTTWQTSVLRPGDGLVEARFELPSTAEEAPIRHLGMSVRPLRRLLLESKNAVAPPDFQRGTPDLLFWCPLGPGLEGDGSECIPIEQAMRDPEVVQCWKRDSRGETWPRMSCDTGYHLQPQIRQRRSIRNAPDELRRVVGAADGELGDVLAIRGETLGALSRMGVWVSRVDYTDNPDGRPVDLTRSCVVDQVEVAVTRAGAPGTLALADLAQHQAFPLAAREMRLVELAIPPEWADADVVWSARMTGSGSIGSSLNEQDTAPRLCVGGYSSSKTDVLPGGDHHFWGGVSTARLYSLRQARYDIRPDLWPQYKCGVAWRYEVEMPESYAHCPIADDPCACTASRPSCFSAGEGFLCGYVPGQI